MLLLISYEMKRIKVPSFMERNDGKRWSTAPSFLKRNDGTRARGWKGDARLSAVHPRYYWNNPLNSFSSDSIEITRGSHCIKLQTPETDGKRMKYLEYYESEGGIHWSWRISLVDPLAIASFRHLSCNIMINVGY